MDTARRSAMPKRGSKQAAFTLIELLVVVSLIALLVSIMLPSLSQAREQARLAKCLSNLHHIGTATHDYFGEYADTFPWFYPIFPIPMGHYYGGRYPPFTDLYGTMDTHTWLRFYPEQRPLNKYLYPRAQGPKADLKIYHCPSDNTSQWDSLDGVLVIPAGFYYVFGTSYGANVLWIYHGGLNDERYWKIYRNYANELTRYKLNIRGAGTFVLLSCPNASSQFHSHVALPSRHRRVGFSELLFLDGHAEFMVTDTWTLGWETKNAEWTFWFNEPERALPARFRRPFPGMEEWQGP